MGKGKSRRRKKTAFDSINLLIANGVEFQVLSKENYHIRICEFDFWASTERYWNRAANKWGFGIQKMLSEIAKSHPQVLPPEVSQILLSGNINFQLNEGPLGDNYEEKN